MHRVWDCNILCNLRDYIRGTQDVFLTWIKFSLHLLVSVLKPAFDCINKTIEIINIINFHILQPIMSIRQKMKHFDLQKKGVHPITGVLDTCISGEP